jgi:hypothetical protein
MTVESAIRAMLDYRLWIHAALSLASLAPKSDLQPNGPTMIRFLDSSNNDNNSLDIIFFVTSLDFFIALVPTKIGWRGPWCIVTCGWSIIFAGLLWGSVQSSKWVRHTLSTLVGGGNNALAQGFGQLVLEHQRPVEV